MNDRTTNGATADVANQPNVTSAATMLDVAGAPSIARALQAADRQEMADFADFAGFIGSGAQ